MKQKVTPKETKQVLIPKTKRKEMKKIKSSERWGSLLYCCSCLMSSRSSLISSSVGSGSLSHGNGSHSNGVGGFLAPMQKRAL